MIRVANACDAPIAMVLELPLSVTVEVPALNSEDEPDVSQEPDAIIDPVVNEIVLAEESLMVTPATEMDEAVPISVPPPETVRLAPPVRLFPDVSSVPVMERIPVTSVALLCVTMPDIVRLLKPLVGSRVRRVVLAPDRVTVLVPLMNVEPAPELSQLPLTAHAPFVTVIVPDVPPFMVTSTTETVEAVAVRMPELPRTNEPPRRERSAVASVVDPAVSWIVRR